MVYFGFRGEQKGTGSDNGQRQHAPTTAVLRSAGVDDQTDQEGQGRCHRRPKGSVTGQLTAQTIFVRCKFYPLYEVGKRLTATSAIDLTGFAQGWSIDDISIGIDVVNAPIGAWDYGLGQRGECTRGSGRCLPARLSDIDQLIIGKRAVGELQTRDQAVGRRSMVVKIQAEAAAHVVAPVLNAFAADTFDRLTHPDRLHGIAKHDVANRRIALKSEPQVKGQACRARLLVNAVDSIEQRTDIDNWGLVEPALTGFVGLAIKGELNQR